jgi:hypothetical protein
VVRLRRRPGQPFAAHSQNTEADVIVTSHPATRTFRIALEAHPNQSYRRELLVRVADALSRGDRRVVVDCSAWSQLDLIVLSALVSCARRCNDGGAEFELENLDEAMRSRIRALSLGDRLGLHG